MREAGGFEDEFGRFHRATPAQQEQRLGQLAHREIARQFPQMSKFQQAGIASNVAMGAGQGVNKELAAAQAQAVEKGLNVNVATLHTLQQLSQKYDQLAQMVRNQQRRNEQSPLPGGGPR